MINVTIHVERNGETRSTSIAVASIFDARVVMDRFFDRVLNVPGAIAGAGWAIKTTTVVE